MIFHLSAQVDQLNCAEDAFMYRLILDGLVLQHGQARLRRASMDCAYETGVNVISIAAATNWGVASKRSVYDGSCRASPTPPAPWSGG